MSTYPFLKGFKAYTFYHKSDESHYGNAITLWTIARQSSARHQLLLAQFYGNENYEKIISSHFTAKDAITRKITEYFGPRNQNGFMDENSKSKISTEKYIIQADGVIKPSKTQKTNPAKYLLPI